jgi:CheY-like chemotaxis protein
MKKPDLIIVDDHLIFRQGLKSLITLENIANVIGEASDGDEFLELLNRLQPDIVLMDIEMPGMNGQDVCKAIKSDPALKDIPVVMMTGLNDDQQKHQAAMNGANSYTLKPTDPMALLHSVLSATNYWLSIHQFPQEHQ